MNKYKLDIYLMKNVALAPNIDIIEGIQPTALLNVQP